MPNHDHRTTGLLLALALGAIALPLPAQAQGAEDEGPFRQIRIAPGIATSDNFIEVLLPFLNNHPESDEGNGGMDLNVQKENGGYRVNMTLTGYLDDSLYGQQYRGYVVRTSTGQWELLEMQVRPLCARGRNVNGICTSAPPPAMFQTPGAADQAGAMCVNVAADDALNVRSGPGTRFQAVGALGPSTCNVILSQTCEGNWCEIQSGPISGWVNTRYLQPGG